ncbi:meiosis protein SPO22/ZIP4 like-domain-containing protein [Diplogelasinospora grovesii]|uniref:Meiosis protein SPO22/ZIP4 like-domain-containing protein n=1 Tax=Diplogelasinospora grovesii TaxID=303347 RepID=A0AAN6S5E0_9PEZI|nr:meiosis protein SPO22/ZIP4 like-domain-containing protein [Diplogelasinospora grovesii]
MPADGSSNHPTDSSDRKGRRVDAAAEFAGDLCQLLSSNPNDATVTDELIEHISKHAEKLRLIQQTRNHSFTSDSVVDARGTQLWNLCTRLRQDCEPAAEERSSRVLVLGRVLAFYLLAIAARSSAKSTIRLMKLSLKAAKDCIDNSGPIHAKSILEKAAGCKKRLQDLTMKLNEDEVGDIKRLEIEYYTLRTYMAFREQNLELAEHMCTKAEELRQFLDVKSAEKLADVLYEIGKARLADNDGSVAIKWLKKALDVMHDHQKSEALSGEGTELRLALLQALVTKLLSLNTPEAYAEAQDYVTLHECNHIVVDLLQLEILRKAPCLTFNSERYADRLLGMIENFKFSHASCKLMLHHIRKLHEKSPTAGCQVLDAFILQFCDSETDGWMEKLVIARIFMITNQRETVESITAVHSLLSEILEPLRADAATAAQTLIWKQLEANFGQGDYELAENWCQLALHKVFRNGSPSNIAKLERKGILCALARESPESAVPLIRDMAEGSLMKQPLTAYLSFKVAIRIKNRDLAAKCLEAVGSSPEHINYLGACISEAQQAGDIACAVAALRKLLDKYDYKEPDPIHLPALLRSQIRLLHILAENGDEDFVQNLCEAFDAVVTALERNPRDSHGARLFNIDELDWFSRNAYNLALSHTKIWDLRCIGRMLTACVKIISHFPPDPESQVEVGLKALFSRFMIASGLVPLARAQDDVQAQVQDYRLIREHVAAFDTQVAEFLQHLDEQSRSDMVRKYATLLAFDFEAAACLGQWGDLGGIVQKAAACHSVAAYQAMADCLIRAQAPREVLHTMLRNIVNEIGILENFDAVKLAKYTRCLFQGALEIDDELAVKLLEETCTKARGRQNTGLHWPEEELQWMVATAFNHAVDCHADYNIEKAQDWATKALDLAGCCEDGGVLARDLRGKILSLGLDVDAM